MLLASHNFNLPFRIVQMTVVLVSRNCDNSTTIYVVIFQVFGVLYALAVFFFFSPKQCLHDGAFALLILDK